MRKIIVFSMLFIFFRIASNTDGIIYFANDMNLYKMLFPSEPVERLYIILWDGRLFMFTTNEWDRVSGIAVIMNFLKNQEIECVDIALFVHNHFARQYFSEANMHWYKWLLRNGFEGAFCIYISGSDTVRCIRKDKQWTIKIQEGNKNASRD